MKYIIDNDLHIHSKISACSGNPEQTAERILQYAEENNYKTICITDHFWDDAVEGGSDWYKPQNYDRISAIKPLPQSENVRFLFGCETELNSDLTLGISKEKLDLFDFLVIPTTHFHMRGFVLTEEEADDINKKAKAWVRHFEAVIDMDLPFEKIGIAHLTCGLIANPREDYLAVLNLIPDSEMERVFTKAARLGVGIELNSSDMDFAEDEAETVLRPYRIAKKCGCKFYLGSDAHKPEGLDAAYKIFERAVDVLGLTEDDKFRI